jgi:hypothetical protein
MLQTAGSIDGVKVKADSEGWNEVLHTWQREK